MFDLSFIYYYLYHINYALTNRDTYNKAIAQRRLECYRREKINKCEDVRALHSQLLIYCLEALTLYFNVYVNLKFTNSIKGVLFNDIEVD
jgi:hypothetical protein